MVKNIAITGAGGVLGKRIVENFLMEGDSVLCISSSLKSDSYEKPYLLTLVSPSEVISNKSFLENIDILIHCAFPRSNNPSLLAEGIQFSYDIFHTAFLAGVPSIINVSSQSVYRQTRDCAVNESTPVHPETLYGMAKYSTELILEATYHDLIYSNIRLASLIDPSLQQRVVNKLVVSGINNGVINISNTTARFGFMDVDDAALAITTMARSRKTNWSQKYVLGPTGSYTLVEIGKTVLNYLSQVGIECKIQINTINNSKLNTSCDPRLFYQDFKWGPSLTLKDTVKRIVDKELLGK